MVKRHFLPARIQFSLSYVPVSDRCGRRRRRLRRPQLRAEADVVGAGGQEWVAVVVVVFVVAAAAADELVVRWTRRARPPGATYDIWYINVFITILFIKQMLSCLSCSSPAAGMSLRNILGRQRRMPRRG